MRKGSSLKRRVREIEEAHGAGAVTLTFEDGTSRGFSLRRNDRLKILLGAFDIAHAAVTPGSSARAREVAQLLGKAKDIAPRDRLLENIAAGMRQVEKEKCTNHAPSPVSS